MKLLKAANKEAYDEIEFITELYGFCVNLKLLKIRLNSTMCIHTCMCMCTMSLYMTYVHVCNCAYVILIV